MPFDNKLGEDHSFQLHPSFRFLSLYEKSIYLLQIGLLAETASLYSSFFVAGITADTIIGFATVSHVAIHNSCSGKTLFTRLPLLRAAAVSRLSSGYVLPYTISSRLILRPVHGLHHCKSYCSHQQLSLLTTRLCGITMHGD